jgi:hypothetical protein
LTIRASALVSTPSATMVCPRIFPMVVIAATIAES